MTGTGEGTLAELSDGRIYYNSRSHMSIDHKRRIAWSLDGETGMLTGMYLMTCMKQGNPSILNTQVNQATVCVPDW